jgi:hypothetical protein
MAHYFEPQFGHLHYSVPSHRTSFGSHFAIARIECSHFAALVLFHYFARLAEQNRTALRLSQFVVRLSSQTRYAL